MTGQLVSEASLIHREADSATFRKNYNKSPFLLHHELHRHPLFQMDRLMQLAETVSAIPGRLAYSIGKIGVNRGWDMSQERRLSPQEVFEHLDSADAWMILKSAQVDPEYAELLSKVLDEIHQASDQSIANRITSQNMSVIITSPGRITPYHMDADCNYLLQISGEKCMYVFDGSNREVVSCEELERFYAGDINAALYKEATQEKAYAFNMEPGNGVHVPVGFPHWVQNGDQVSVSVSLNFCFVDRTVPDIYRINHYLRKRGMHPTPPGRSVLVDKTKSVAAALARTARGKSKANN